MSKRSFSITDKNNRLLNYYLNRSDKDWNLVINEAIKNYVAIIYLKSKFKKQLNILVKTHFQLTKFLEILTVAG